MALTLYDDVGLREQIRRQKLAAWSLDSIDWARGFDTTRFFLPLDHDALFFPGASKEQRLALSQYFGMVVNATIAEMEKVIHKLKDHAWEKLLRNYPTQPEVRELGEMFFGEEEKHSVLFDRSIDRVCEAHGFPRSAIDAILPQSLGSPFLITASADAAAGGSIFWWVVAAVEEVSVEIYKALHPHQKNLDPLYFQIHRKHFEEEARHRPYAFLMLDLYHESAYRQGSPFALRRKVMRRLGWLRSQKLILAWMLGELAKVRRVGELRNIHPFFKTLETCLPLFERTSWSSRVHRIFVTAPYLSYLLNPGYHRHTQESAGRHHVWNFHWTKPLSPELVTE